MARYRPPEYCHHCGKQLEAIHKDRGSHFVGDTFMGYKECECRKPNKEPEVQASVARDGDSSNADDYQKLLEENKRLKEEYGLAEIKIGQLQKHLQQAEKYIDELEKSHYNNL